MADHPVMHRGVFLWALLLSDAGTAASSSYSRQSIDNPLDYWSQSYIPLIPSIHPPTTHDHGDLIQVWLKLPPGGKIDVQWLEDQQRHTLVYPEGTRADRVEYFFVGNTVPNLVDYALFGTGQLEEQNWTVADVRGTTLVEGRQWFHVYRPAGSEPHAKLIGWRWPRDNEAAKQKATQALIDHASTTKSALAAKPLDKSGLQALRRLNDCAACHQQNQPRIRLGNEERSVDRATDTMGFVVPNAVLRDECIIADHRTEDLNLEDEFVDVYCADGGEATLRQDKGREWFTCRDGSAPRGRRDVAAGLKSGHPYTQSVCDSRQALWSNMTHRAR
ncbi:hypothetical protein [Bowmanella dokdonensis]|uniref:Uncharacterized protein n=1 Tax=Bowmanella dokdonensis TaxID=751969 RepID=A0A939DKR1_9ALTE|nr:hypothetical protein [Bowmanella dokdonensis]MBN7824288.1 hypothetical protein [Bowmanella dokdonensis]